jgi:hypothetical protein
MNIQGFVGTNEKYSVEAIAQDSMREHPVFANVPPRREN